MFERLTGLFKPKNREEPAKDLGIKSPIFTSLGASNSFYSSLAGTSDDYDSMITASKRRQAMYTDDWKSVPSIVASVNLIKGFIGEMDWRFYIKTDNTDDELLTNEPYLNILNNPGHGLSGKTFKRCLIESYLTKGGFAFHIERGINGLPTGLVILDVNSLSEKDMTSLNADTSDIYSEFNYNGVYLGKTVNTNFLKTDVVLALNLNSDTSDKSSNLESLALDNGVYVGSKVFQKEYFDNGASPGTYIKCDEEPGQEEVLRMERSFMSKFGKGNRHKPMIGSGDISVIGNGMKDIDITALNTDLARDTSFAFGVPSSLLGYTSSSNRATIEKEEQNFRVYILKPLIATIDDEITSKYLNEAYFGSVYSKHDDVAINSTLDGTQKASNVLASIGKIYTVNEARKVAGLPRIDDERYDRLDIADENTINEIKSLIAKR